MTFLEAPNQQQCNESLFRKNDVEAIVNYMYDQLNLNKSINASYYTFGKDAHDSKMERIDGFEEWFSGRPKHLKELIEDISNNHKLIEPRVSKLSNLLNEQEAVNNQINSQKKRYVSLSKKYNLYKSLCEENCGHKISKRSIDENLYCGTAKQIKDKSTLEMENYVEKLKPELITIIKNVSESYDTDIQDMEQKIKEAALKAYGPTMYKTLLLQDDYRTYKELVSQNSEKKIYDIKKTVSMMDAQLTELELAVDKYKQHCISCSEISITRVSRMIVTSADDVINSQNEFGSLLDIVIESKKEQIRSQAMNDITNIFHDVNERINAMLQREMDMKNFEPVQEDIKNELDKERETLSAFIKIVSKESIDAFFSLEEPAEQLKSDISNLFNELQKNA
ncbi:unnamed protein product [Colias eurytheme]|nr:unnamed protein product [Colias eurytheme]